MKTYIANVIMKTDIPHVDRWALTVECYRYNRMFRHALNIVMKGPQGEDSVFTLIRKRFPDPKYCTKFGLTPVTDPNAGYFPPASLMATNPIAQNLLSDVTGLAKSVRASLDLNIEAKIDALAQNDKKIRKEQKILDEELVMKQSLIDRSKARKAGKRCLPPFKNRDKGTITVKGNKNGELSFEASPGCANRSRKKAPREPLVFENEYLFELKYLDPLIAKQKAKLGRIRGRRNDTAEVLEKLKRDKKSGHTHVCLGGHAMFMKQYDILGLRNRQKKCRGDRKAHPRNFDWRQTWGEFDYMHKPRRSLYRRIAAEREVRDWVPTDHDDADYRKEWEKAYHQEWLEAYRKGRNRPMLLMGNRARLCGNDLVRYDVHTRELLLTVAEGEEIRIPGVVFEYGQKLIDEAVTADCRNVLEEEKYPRTGKWPEKAFDPEYFTSSADPTSVTWTILDLGDAFRITCTLDVPENRDINTDYSTGCVSFDMNWDNIAIAENDGQGNLLLPPSFEMDENGQPVLPAWLTKADRQHIQLEQIKDRKTGKELFRMKRVIPVRMEGRSSEQIESDISMALEHAFLWARLQKKPMGMEDIKKLKKDDMMYGSRKRNYKVTMFSYRKMTELAENKAQKYGVGLKKVDPRYTSQIAKFKYMRRFGLSIHVCAAYVIGRRALGLAEPVPKEMVHLLPEKIRVKDEESHWWYLHLTLKSVPVKEFYRKIPYQDMKTTTELRKFLLNQTAEA